jgi:two-component system response regulator GlrR
VPVDVRILSATHRNLEAQIAAGRFREDLYYRLHVVSLTLPPLADRRDDIPLLTTHFLRKLATRYGRKIGSFSPEARQLLLAASWPGNVRQLYNVVEQAVALCPSSVIPASLVQNAISAAEEILPLDEARGRFERDYLCQVLRSTGGSVTQAARVARRNRTDLYKLLQRHGLDSSMFRGS